MLWLHSTKPWVLGTGGKTSLFLISSCENRGSKRLRERLKQGKRASQSPSPAGLTQMSRFSAPTSEVYTQCSWHGVKMQTHDATSRKHLTFSFSQTNSQTDQDTATNSYLLTFMIFRYKCDPTGTSALLNGCCATSLTCMETEVQRRSATWCMLHS